METSLKDTVLSTMYLLKREQPSFAARPRTMPRTRDTQHAPDGVCPPRGTWERKGRTRHRRVTASLDTNTGHRPPPTATPPPAPFFGIDIPARLDAARPHRITSTALCTSNVYQSKLLSVPLGAVVANASSAVSVLSAELVPAGVPAVSVLELAALLAHGATQAAAVHAKVVAWFGLRCGAAVRKVRGGKAHVIHSRNGGKCEGPHGSNAAHLQVELASDPRAVARGDAGDEDNKSAARRAARADFAAGPFSLRLPHDRRDRS